MDIKYESYYSDFYDVRTIEECLRSIERFRKEIPAGVSEEENERIINFLLYWIKGNRYENKSSFVMECMSRDRARKELFERCRAPENSVSRNCFANMTVMLKELYELEDPARVLFFMECPKCKKRKGIFDDGTERKTKPETCPQCSGSIKTTFTEKEGGAIWQKDCPSCHFSETEIDDFEISRTERIAREKQEAELLSKYRTKFCLSREEGASYLQERQNLEALSELVEKIELKKKDPDYQKAATLKKWTVVELEKALTEGLAKNRYEKLALNKPEIGRFVIIPFTVQDGDPERKDRDSELKLRKIIKATLEKSNWRLMSEGMSYRLGYLSGRLKGYEAENDLVQLIKQEEKER